MQVTLELIRFKASLVTVWSNFLIDKGGKSSQKKCIKVSEQRKKYEGRNIRGTLTFYSLKAYVLYFWAW